MKAKELLLFDTKYLPLKLKIYAYYNTKEAFVQFATLDNQLIGEIIPIHSDGYFSNGGQMLQGLTGQMRLKLAITYTAYPDITIYSYRFSVALGGEGIPPAPPGALSPFPDVNFQPDQLELAGIRNNMSTQVLAKGFTGKFYRATDLHILSVDDHSLVLNYKGALEFAPSPAGPWRPAD